MTQPKDPPPSPAPPRGVRRRHYRELLRQTLARQIMLYFLPLLFLAAFFNLQYWHFTEKNRRAHLNVIAEQQANTLDLFLRERLVNLANLIDDQAFTMQCCSKQLLETSLARLRQASNTFVDLGVVDERGHLSVYQGPVTFPATVSYQSQPWFQDLIKENRQWIITDIYLGFRGKPHFTIAVKRQRGETIQILRSALSPEKITEFLRTIEGAREVQVAVVNRQGIYQVVTQRGGKPFTPSPFLPPHAPSRGYLKHPDSLGSSSYAYAWLSGTPWALVVRESEDSTASNFVQMPSSVFLITFCFFILMGVVILVRARQLVGKQLAVEQHEAELSGQLVQAAKLASVGELAAGIAHEINNPLAIIAEEVGLIKDMMDPELAQDETPLDIGEHLEAIHEAAFRCRDITRKLLTFVRQAEVKLEQHHVNKILNEVLDGMLNNELRISNVEVFKIYDPEIPAIVTDRNQLVQVFVNLVKNAIDAMAGGGKLTVRTVHHQDHCVIAISDTGCGMTAEQIEKVFMPFFTTKEPGKGTGLGLSVSLSIIKNFNGKMYVESAPGQGSAFIIELPYEIQ
jgi:two-component system, NtrC family, sensor kinase